MDVKTSFLNCTIDEEVYIKKPLGFEVKDKEGYVYRLKKALYGLKQAPRAWYARMDAYLQRFGFIKSSVDPNLYIKVVKDEPVIILIYVDDILLTCVEERIQEWKYVIEILKRFDMMECKPMTTPMITNLRLLRNSESILVDPTRYKQFIGSLMYLVNTRPDICFAVNVLSQFQIEPRHDHWVATKHILRYLRGTIYHCLKYEKGKDVLLTGFIDSDWGGYEKDGRNTTGGCFSLGLSMVSWMSRKKETVAISSVEAEYVAACEVSREAVWLRKLLSDLFSGPLAPTTIHCDNTSCIRLFEDPFFHGKTNHINNKYHYIRKLVQDGVLKLEYAPTNEQTADILTKLLLNKKLVYFRDKLGLVYMSSLFERER
eukprot:PITA_19705